MIQLYPVTFSVCGTLKLKLKESMKYNMITWLSFLQNSLMLFKRQQSTWTVSITWHYKLATPLMNKSCHNGHISSFVIIHINATLLHLYNLTHIEVKISQIVPCLFVIHISYRIHQIVFTNSVTMNLQLFSTRMNVAIHISRT